MLDRLVTVGVVTHVHHRHLTNLVDYLAIVAIVEQRRNREDRIQHLHERSLATHQVDQALRIMEHTPRVVPAVTLGEGITPFQRREGGHELAILQAATHQVGLLVEEVTIVQRTASEKLLLLLRTIQVLRQLPDAPVIVGILQRASSVLVDLHVVRYITQRVVIFVSTTAR